MVGRSKVWQLAQFADGGRTEVKCNLCPARIKFVGNTTNIARHLEIKHPVEFAALDPISSSSLQARHEQLHRHEVEKRAQHREEEAICRILAQHRAELTRHAKKEGGADVPMTTGTVALTPAQLWSWHSPVFGLTGGDDRGSSEYSQNEEETAVTASPEQFLADTSEREPTPAPASQTPPKPESYQLRHNNHLTIVLEALARDEAFMDVTLTAQGRSLKAHKSVLSAVSPYFRGVLRENPCQHPIIIMPRDVRFEELFSIVNYIYKGEMTVAAEDLTSLLKTAEILQVSGLAPSDSTATAVNPQPDLSTSGNIRSSSASSSSSSNVASIPKAAKPVKETNQGISAPTARPKSPDAMINPSDFMDMDMTYVKEEVQSGGEEDDDTATSEASAQPPPSASPKTNEVNQQDSISFPSMYNPNQEQPSASTSSSQDYSNPVVKTETDSTSNVEPDKSCAETSPPFVCPHCQEQHRGVDNMTTHLRLNHPTKPSFTCGCGRVYTRNMLYQAHVKICSSAS